MQNTDRPATFITNGPRMLPKVTLSNGKTYFIDERLRQLRNVQNPHDYIDEDNALLSLADVDKIISCSDSFTQFVNIICCKCNKCLFSGTEEEAKGLTIHCPDCFDG